MEDEPEFRQLRDALSGGAPVPDEAWPLLKSVFQVRRLSAKEFALRPGAQGGLVFFVCSGLLRYFSAQARQREYTKGFLWENTFSPPLGGCSLDLELVCGVQALEPSVVLVAAAEEFRALYDRHPAFDRLGRRIGEQWLEQKEARALTFQVQDAKQRYETFVQRNPHLVQRVAQVHIASYLGITEVSLSRIRRQLVRPQRPRQGEKVAISSPR